MIIRFFMAWIVSFSAYGWDDTYLEARSNQYEKGQKALEAEIQLEQQILITYNDHRSACREVETFLLKVNESTAHRLASVSVFESLGINGQSLFSGGVVGAYISGETALIQLTQTQMTLSQELSLFLSSHLDDAITLAVKQSTTGSADDVARAIQLTLLKLGSRNQAEFKALVQYLAKMGMGSSEAYLTAQQIGQHMANLAGTNNQHNLVQLIRPALSETGKKSAQEIAKKISQILISNSLRASSEWTKHIAIRAASTSMVSGICRSLAQNSTRFISGLPQAAKYGLRVGPSMILMLLTPTNSQDIADTPYRAAIQDMGNFESYFYRDEACGIFLDQLSLEHFQRVYLSNRVMEKVNESLYGYDLEEPTMECEAI